MNWNQGECLSIFTFLAEFLETCLMGANEDLISIQTVYGKKLLKMSIVHCAMGKLENHQVLSFQSGFRDLKNDRIWCCIFFQTVNRKKSGFRASLQFSQKTNEKLRLYYYGTSSQIVFVRFLGELKTPKRHFEINWTSDASGLRCCLTRYINVFEISQKLMVSILASIIFHEKRVTNCYSHQLHCTAQVWMAW